jgi:hypothetical protein
MFLSLFVLLAIGAVSWFLVLNQAARRKFVSKHWSIFGWSPFKISEEQREVDDTLTLACSLISAVTSSTILLFVLLASIVKLFR